MKEILEKQIVDLKRARDNLEHMDIGEPSKKVAKSGLTKEIRQLNSEISTLKSRERTNLKLKEINGVQIEIPRALSTDRDVEYHFEDGALYQIKKPYLDKDGSFHLWHYVWIDEGKKQTKLVVRTLGNDKYGDRYFLETRYYKDKRDEYSYLHKYIDKNNQKYKKHVDKVIELLRGYEGFQDFFKAKKGDTH